MDADKRDPDVVLKLSQKAQVLVLECPAMDAWQRLAGAARLFRYLPLPPCSDDRSLRAVASIMSRTASAVITYPLKTCPGRENVAVTSPNHVARALATIWLHHSDHNLTAESIATNVGLSVWYLSRLVNAATGSGLGDHLRAMRLVRTMGLMRTELSIKEIAFCTGYLHTSSLDHQFLKCVGMCPGEFRRSAAAEQWSGLSSRCRGCGRLLSGVMRAF